MTMLNLDQITDDDIAEILNQAFDFKEKNEGHTVIVKASGKTVDDPDRRRRYNRQTLIMRRDLGLNVMSVNGAKNQITAEIEASGQKSEFDPKTSLRISRASHIDPIDLGMWKTTKLLCEDFNLQSKGRINALALAGYNANLITAMPLDPSGDDFSGVPVDVNVSLLRAILADTKTVPFISSMCSAAKVFNGVNKINVNADDVAALLAIKMGASRLLLCSDVQGVKDKQGQLIREIRTDKISELIADGTISGGMIRKIEAAGQTAQDMPSGGAVVIMDENFLVELLTPKGRGTMVRHVLNG